MVEENDRCSRITEQRGGCPNSAITIRYGKIPVAMAVARPSGMCGWLLDYLCSTTTLKRKLRSMTGTVFDAP
jgi:hypothetical protein